MIAQEDLEEISIETSIKVHNNHNGLGKEGLRKHPEKNQFGETPLEGDWRAEEIWIEQLRKDNVPITINSEEHGKVELGKDFLGALDGLDGTNRYLLFMAGDKNARYATIFAIYNGVNPRYEDYIVSVIMEHPTKRLLLASRGKGVSLVNLETRERTPIDAPFGKEFTTERIRGNTHSGTKFFDVVKRSYLEPFSEFDLQSDKVALRSNAVCYVDFALGKADWVLDVTFKHNLEKAVGYPFVRERGGVVLTLDEEDIGSQKYLEFHFDSEDYVPILAVPSIEVARPIIDRIRKYSAPTGI